MVCITSYTAVFCRGTTLFLYTLILVKGRGYREIQTNETLIVCCLFQDLEFHGVMRFFHQDAGEKVSTKCIRVSSTATTRDVLDTLIEKFRPDMRMLSLPEYSLYEVHVNGGENNMQSHIIMPFKL